MTNIDRLAAALRTIGLFLVMCLIAERPETDWAWLLGAIVLALGISMTLWIPAGVVKKEDEHEEN